VGSSCRVREARCCLSAECDFPLPAAIVTLAVSALEVRSEEGDDPAPRVLGGLLVMAGCCGLGEQLDPERQLRGIVVIEEAVAGIGIQLDVVVDASRLERGLKAIGNIAHSGPAIPPAVAGDDRAGLGQEALAFVREAARNGRAVYVTPARVGPAVPAGGVARRRGCDGYGA
jgi:hypothetical protein